MMGIQIHKMDEAVLDKLSQVSIELPLLLTYLPLLVMKYEETVSDFQAAVMMGTLFQAMADLVAVCQKQDILETVVPPIHQISVLLFEETGSTLALLLLHVMTAIR